jgi:hypothetical protein
MLSFFDHTLSPSSKTLASFVIRLTAAVARLHRIAGPSARGGAGQESEPLPCFRGRNLLREDIGLAPLDRDGLPL